MWQDVYQRKWGQYILNQLKEDDFWLHLVQQVTKYVTHKTDLHYDNKSLNSNKDRRRSHTKPAALQASIASTIMQSRINKDTLMYIGIVIYSLL
jgi:hypothetical protein